MNRFFFICLTLVLTMWASAQTNYRSEVWSPDNGDGTYTNPVINAETFVSEPVARTII